MFIRSCIVGLVTLGLVFLAGSASAATSSIEGIVKDPKGKAIKGAEIRVETKEGHDVGKVKTDANGRYLYSGLQPGKTYSVTLVINSVVKASLKNVKAELGRPEQLNFDLKKDSAATGKKPKRMVWIPAQTGTNLGGRWVEVYDDGSTAAGDVARSKTLEAGAMKGLQGRSF